MEILHDILVPQRLQNVNSLIESRQTGEFNIDNENELINN